MHRRILGLDLSRSKIPICPVLQESSHWKEAILPGGGACSSMHGSKHLKHFLLPVNIYQWASVVQGVSSKPSVELDRWDGLIISWVRMMAKQHQQCNPAEVKSVSCFISCPCTPHGISTSASNQDEAPTAANYEKTFPFLLFSALALQLNNLAVTSCKELFHSDGVLPRQNCNLTNVVIMDSRITWAFLPILFSPGFASKIDSSHWLFGKKKKDVRKIISCAL